MTFRRKALSDEEYVEKVRKGDRTIRRIRWIWPLLFIGLICCLFAFLELIPRLAAQTDKVTGDGSFYGGLALGAMFGLLFVFTAAQAGHAIKEWLDARRGFRTERLMLRYHDELQGKEGPNVVPRSRDEGTSP